MAFPGLPKEGLAFLASLARNNRREWFQPRKELFEQTVKLPMADLASELNGDLAKVAPEHVVDEPDRALSRIYRDTRFAKDKSPYKTNVYAVWPRRGAARHEGAAFYLSVSAKSVEAGGGVWMPPPDVLGRVRGWVAEEHGKLRKILAAPRLAKVGELYEEDKLARVPRGFDADHPAADLLRLKSFIVVAEVDPKIATTPKLHKELARVFAGIAPFIAAMDEACAG